MNRERHGKGERERGERERERERERWTGRQIDKNSEEREEICSS